MKNDNVPHPTSIVIFGGTGDLTNRKLIPAFYNLYISKNMPENFRIVLIGRGEVKETEFKNGLLKGINEFSRSGKADTKKWKAFSAKIVYLQGDLVMPDLYLDLKTRLDGFEKQDNEKSLRIFYLAIPPKYIENVAEGLYTNKLCNKAKSDRIVVEKPFGTDLASAIKLNNFLQHRFKEEQIFRIDHYLGKETVQNIMAFRFANSVFEPLWNNKYIDHVQISLAEHVSIEQRGAYYDNNGALKDMIQNHLLQLLCVVAMECPGKDEPELIRNSKVAVLKDIRPFTTARVFKNIVKAQYTAGTMDGEAQVSYLQEDFVAKGSATETYVAAKFLIDNEKWKGVPFFLRTGKCLPKQSSVIVIQFKPTPNKIFANDIVPNRLIISIQPEQKISLLFESKVPGVQMKLKPVEMDFTYKESYSEQTPEAYEALLLDTIEGDASLFMRSDQVEAAWKVVMPILNAWKKDPKRALHRYKAGTWGPAAANELIKPFSKEWMLLPEIKK
ncbi:MAG: glucose-6-phosphate dehydrogenase [Gloeobacteraceae cyanobacterium ES-bin-316]|nr:glucose-6-phosphate dehydrogenase [Ferruginibacter sp.]